MLVVVVFAWSTRQNTRLESAEFRRCPARQRGKGEKEQDRGDSRTGKSLLFEQYLARQVDVTGGAGVWIEDRVGHLTTRADREPIQRR